MFLEFYARFFVPAPDLSLLQFFVQFRRHPTVVVGGDLAPVGADAVADAVDDATVHVQTAGTVARGQGLVVMVIGLLRSWKTALSLSKNQRTFVNINAAHQEIHQAMPSAI